MGCSETQTLRHMYICVYIYELICKLICVAASIMLRRQKVPRKPPRRGLTIHGPRTHLGSKSPRQGLIIHGPGRHLGHGHKQLGLGPGPIETQGPQLAPWDIWASDPLWPWAHLGLGAQDLTTKRENLGVLATMYKIQHLHIQHASKTRCQSPMNSDLSVISHTIHTYTQCIQ
jgi:hypothetical protein